MLRLSKPVSSLSLASYRYKPIEVFVRIESGANLPAADSGGVSDPYAKLKMDGHEYKTTTLHKTVDPVWDQEFVWRGPHDTDKMSKSMLAKPLHIRVYDDDVFSRDDKLGECDVDLAPLVDKLQENEETKAVVNLDTKGTVTLAVKWIWCEPIRIHARSRPGKLR